MMHVFGTILFAYCVALLLQVPRPLPKCLVDLQFPVVGSQSPVLPCYKLGNQSSPKNLKYF
jgi:hypothetical protein